jgi:CheY-like chemotaxis protein
VLSALQASDTADIPIIVHSVSDERHKALAAGACEHLVKPADRDVLAAMALRFARAPARTGAAQEEEDASNLAKRA